MLLSTTHLDRLAVLAAVLAASTGTLLAQQYAPYGYSSPQPQQTYAPQAYTPQTYAPQYAAVAYQPNGVNMPSYNNLESVPPGPMQQAPQVAARSAPMQPTYRVANTEAIPQPNPNYESYSAGPATGGYGANYNTFSGGCTPYTNGGNVCYSCCTPCGPRRHWFGGVYGLLMDRVNCGNSFLAFESANTSVGYYPTDSEIEMTSADIDNDVMGGAEFRFGATCAAHGGCGGYGGCGDCSTGCGPLAWEVAYWGLAEDTTTDTVNVMPGFRLHGMLDFRGLVYNSRPVNEYFDYGPPTTDNSMPYDIVVHQLQARNTFSAQNLELNLLRLPLLGGGFAGCGSCDPCGGGPCGVGCCGPRCQVTTMIGARYMRFDEDFYFRSDYERMDNNMLEYLAYNVEADNELVGFQIGATGAYYLGFGGRFALQCSTNAGVYLNHMEVTQWMDAPVGGGPVTVNPTGENFYSSSDEDEVAFLGELRVGASYQCTCNCRLYAGYRALGVTGVALTANQVPGAFSSLNQIGYINCSGSIFLHGLQSGIEFCY